MKKLLLLVMTMSTLMAQDIAGAYRVSALDVQYYDIARETTNISVTDAYGMGVEIVLATINAGDVFYGTHSGPYNEAALAAIGVNLNVNFNEDGSCTLDEGSYYPDAEEENCVTSVHVLPITDNMAYESSLAAENVSPLPSVNLIGQASISARAGTPAGGLALETALVFDKFPFGAVGYLNQYGPDLTPNTGDEVAPVTIPYAVNQAGLLAGENLHGVHGGWVIKGGLGGSQIPTSDRDPDLYAEWHAIDGEAAESGFGDFDDVDEDGDGTDFDRQLGYPAVSIATITPDCPVMPGLTQPIFGGQAIVDALHDVVEAGCVTQISADFPAACTAYGVGPAINGLCLDMGADEDTCGYIASSFAAASGGDCDVALAMATTTGEGNLCYTAADIAEDMCVVSTGSGNDGYVMDTSLSTWSNLLTGNAAQFSGCLAATGGDMAFCASSYPQWLADDSDHDFDPATGTGRLHMIFTPTCIPEVEVRQVVIEAIALGGTDIPGCTGSGDVNSDGGANVLDIVQVVSSILGTLQTPFTFLEACNADVNLDGQVNVLDVVSLVQLALGRTTDSASTVEIIKSSEGVSFVADGYVGAIQMTINHDDNFSIEMTDKAMVADYNTEGNSTILMVVNPESDELFIAEGEFTIETVVAAANGEEYIPISVLPTAFSVSNAYPNPFNPTTSLNINLDADSHVSVKVFNVMGQLVDVVTEGQMTEGTHAISWDASTVASGVYFINTEVGSSLSSQKVMLLK